MIEKSSARRTPLGAKTEELIGERVRGDRALRLSDLDQVIAETVLKVVAQAGYAKSPNDGIAITATSGGVLVLTKDSEDMQILTGNSGHTVELPDVATLHLGRTFRFRHTGTSGLVVIESSGGTALGTGMPPGTDFLATCIALTGTDATPWLIRYDGAGSRAGSGSLVLNAAPLLNNATFTPSVPGTDPATNGTYLIRRVTADDTKLEVAYRGLDGTVRVNTLNLT
jgi:hypothetical protein